jgi:hypothetical protein
MQSRRLTRPRLSVAICRDVYSIEILSALGEQAVRLPADPGYANLPVRFVPMMRLEGGRY